MVQAKYSSGGDLPKPQIGGWHVLYSLVCNATSHCLMPWCIEIWSITLCRREPMLKQVVLMWHWKALADSNRVVHREADSAVSKGDGERGKWIQRCVLSKTQGKNQALHMHTKSPVLLSGPIFRGFLCWQNEHSHGWSLAPPPKARGQICATLVWGNYRSHR